MTAHLRMSLKEAIEQTDAYSQCVDALIDAISAARCMSGLDRIFDKVSLDARDTREAYRQFDDSLQNIIDTKLLKIATFVEDAADRFGLSVAGDPVHVMDSYLDDYRDGSGTQVLDELLVRLQVDE